MTLIATPRRWRRERMPSVRCVDCDFAAFCLPGSNIGVCECVESGCRANEERVNDLWLIREGDELIANFVGAVFDYGTPGRFLPIGNIRFRRE